MASQTMWAGTAASVTVTGSSGTWTSISNATGSSTSTYAYWSSTSAGSVSPRIRLYNFGFTIPTSATIDGIVVTVYGAASVASTMRLNEGIWLTGSTNANPYAGTETKSYSTLFTGTTVQTRERGGSSDMWGGAFTPAGINSSSFGTAFQMRKQQGTTSVSARVHRVSITVYYTDNAGPVFTNQPTLTPTNGRTRMGPVTPGNITFRVTDDSTGANALSYQIRNSSTPGGGTVYGSGTCTNNVTKTHTFEYSDYPDESNISRALYVHVTDPDGATTVSDMFIYNPDHAPPYAGFHIVTVTPDPTTTNQYTVSFSIRDVESTNPDELSYYVRSSQGVFATNYLTGNATSDDALDLLVTDNNLVHGPNTRWLLLVDGANNQTYYELTVNAYYVQTYDELDGSLTVRSVFDGVDEIVPDTEPPILLGSVTHSPDPVKKEG